MNDVVIDEEPSLGKKAQNCVELGLVKTRVVSSEISGRKFPEISSNLSGNFRKFVNYPCQTAVSKSSITK